MVFGTSPHLILVRHGETPWNPDGRYQSRTDMPLTDRGYRQAALLGDRFANLPFARAFASPAIRAVETATIILRAQDRPPALLTDCRLREIDHGPFEGMSPADILASPLAEPFTRWHCNHSPEFPAGVESH